ncbi:hypothetical protein BHE74_00014997 [Ensete ventricosum]|nr:hypothetical protein GW17_00052631 [Ensete ventricosum]RWW76882.1 hypothetical protein BHE74_00014997 [Ensete ventricosum]
MRRSRRCFPLFLVTSDEEKATRRRPQLRSRHLARLSSSTAPSQGSPTADVSDNRATALPLKGDIVRGTPSFSSFSCYFFPQCRQADTAW